MEDYSLLWKPIYINGMRIKNRISLSPMGTFTPMQDGTESEEGIRYYEERAKGGTGLIQTGAMFISDELAQGSPTIAVWNHRSLPKQTVMIERCHRWGAKVCLQLSCGTGRNGVYLPGVESLVSASEVPSFYQPEKLTRAMTGKEIDETMELWKTCTENALLAGYDAIEIHAHAGYLMDQFMSSNWNHRTDKYGGSLENRCRFAVETIRAVRSVAGPSFPILYRISLDHRFNGGRTLEDSVKILSILEDAGVDAFDVDAGCYESMDYIFPTAYTGEACMAYICEKARKYTTKPLINTGNHSMETAAELLDSGNADMIQFGRQLIADPEFPNKLKNGQREDIRPCLLCNEECIGRIFGRMTQLSCAVNPSAGLEDYMKDAAPLPDRRRIAVIGAGPGGLEAARTAALRGCDVTVFDKKDHIGGTLIDIATASWKKRIRDLIRWYDLQLKKHSVKVELNKEIDPRDPALSEYDEIFVASGSKPFIPASVHITEDANAIDVTAAHLQGIDSDDIIICGGGYSGCDSALELAEKGKKDITIVEMLSDVALNAMPINKMSIDRLIAEKGIKVLRKTTVRSISADGVLVEDSDGNEQLLRAKTVITAFGQKPDRTMADAIEKQYPLKLTIIGDCNKVGKAGTAIRDGYYAAMALQ